MSVIGRCFLAECWTLCLAVAAGCHSAPPDTAKCEFHYDDKVLQSVVIPAMRATMGNGGEISYNLRRPFVSVEHGNVVIVFMFNDESAIDTPKFELTLDPCTMHVIEAGESTAITPD